jgi:hypothetical protein
MSRFVLHVDGGPDEVIEAPTVAQAKCEAVRFAGQLICNFADKFWDTAAFSMAVTDSDGLVLFTLQFVGTEAPAIRGTAR